MNRSKHRPKYSTRTTKAYFLRDTFVPSVRVSPPYEYSYAVSVPRHKSRIVVQRVRRGQKRCRLRHSGGEMPQATRICVPLLLRTKYRYSSQTGEAFRFSAAAEHRLRMLRGAAGKKPRKRRTALDSTHKRLVLWVLMLRLWWLGSLSETEKLRADRTSMGISWLVSADFRVAATTCSGAEYTVEV